MAGCLEDERPAALGLRSDFDIRQALERQVEAERWTQLDRQLVRDADRHGVIDLAAIATQ